MEYYRKGVRFILKNEYPYVGVYVTREDVLHFAKVNGFRYYDYENDGVARTGMVGFMYITACGYGLCNNFRKMNGYTKIKRKLLKKDSNKCYVLNNKN